MLNADSITWLYRSLLGRDPESPTTVESFLAAFSDLEAARVAILRSHEFGEQYLRIIRGPTNVSAMSAEELSSYVENSIFGGPVQGTPVHSAELDFTPTEVPIYTMNKLWRTLRPKLILAIGRAEDIKLLSQLFSIIGQEDSLITLISIDTSDGPGEAGGRDAGLIQYGNLVAHYIRLRLSLPVARRLLELLDLSPNLVTVSSNKNLSSEELISLFRMTNNYGVMVIDVAEGREEQALLETSQAVSVDAVPVGRLRFFQKNEWYFPVEVPPSSTQNFWANNLDRIDHSQSICLACLCKNEENFILNMLSSVSPILDYAVFIDTGSVDGTREIIHKFCRDRRLPYDLKDLPLNNFSEARNSLLKMVPSFIKWILVMDADETISMDDLSALADLTHGESDCWALPRYNFFDREKVVEPAPYPDRQLRLFRNYPDHRIHYVGAVHERPLGMNRLGLAPPNLKCLGGGSGGPHIHHMTRLRSGQQSAEKTALYNRLSLEN